MNRTSCALVGAALDLGQKKKGPELAPSWLRLKGLKNLLNKKFIEVSDLGDLSSTQEECFSTELPSMDEKFFHLSKYAMRLSQLIDRELRDDHFVLTIGGDHSLAAGTLGGTLSYDPDVKIIWVDAHADINTPETSPTGHTHGMPLALAMNLINDPKISEMFSFIPKLDPRNIVYIGLRDVDSGEQDFLEGLNIKHYTAEDVLMNGIDIILQDTLEYLDPIGDSQFHISFDVDGIDPQYFPSTGTPVTGGLDLFQGSKIISTIAETKRLLALDLVEVNPLLGTAADLSTTAESALTLLDALPAMGHEHLNHVDERTYSL